MTQQEDNWKRVIELEAECRKTEMEYKIKQAKYANRQNYINFAIAIITEQNRQTIMGLFTHPADKYRGK